MWFLQIIESVPNFQVMKPASTPHLLLLLLLLTHGLVPVSTLAPSYSILRFRRRIFQLSFTFCVRFPGTFCIRRRHFLHALMRRLIDDVPALGRGAGKSMATSIFHHMRHVLLRPRLGSDRFSDDKTCPPNASKSRCKGFNWLRLLKGSLSDETTNWPTISTIVRHGNKIMAGLEANR